MEIKEIKIKDLKFAVYNPRIITEEEFNGLKNSLKIYGLVDPIIINKDYTIIGGHQRAKAWQELGNDSIPCNIVELDKKQEKKLNIILNSQAISGNYDEIKLNEILEELKLDDNYVDLRLDQLEPLDFNEPEQAKEDDFDIPKEIKTHISRGDVFEFRKKGKIMHRLMCGDSTQIEDVEKLMNGEKADLAHNDPPYGMKKEKDGVKNDNLNFDDLLQFNKDWISLQFTVLKDNGSFYCWGIDEPLMDIYSNILKPYIKTQKATFRNLITWFKGGTDGIVNGNGINVEGLRMYPIADEKCLFVMCGVQGLNNNADNYFEGWEPVRDYLLGERKKAGWDVPMMKKVAGHSGSSRDHWTSKSQFKLPTKEVYTKFQSYCQQNGIDAFKKEYDELEKEYYSTRAYFSNTHDNMNNVWHFERTNSKERETTGGHATPKPILLCERAIKSSCPDGGLVLDFFLGSGSTMAASHQLKRKCYGMELDPKYCDVIVKRMLKLDSTLTIKRNGKNCKSVFI